MSEPAVPHGANSVVRLAGLTRSFEQGGQTKYVTEIKADTVTFLERGERGGEQSSGLDNARPQARPAARGSRSGSLPDGMPF